MLIIKTVRLTGLCGFCTPFSLDADFFISPRHQRSPAPVFSFCPFPVWYPLPIWNFSNDYLEVII